MALSLQDVLDKANKKAQTGKERTAKPKPGKSVWRILPGWNAAEPNQFYQSFGQHFVKDMNGDLKVVVGCSEKTFDEPCDICDAVSEAARAAPNDKVREKILDSKSGQRFLFNAINVTDDPSKVVIMEVGSMLFKDMLTNIAEDETILDPVKGRDFLINREGSGMQTRYSLAVRSKDKSCSVPKSALMELNDLTEYVNEDFEAKAKKAMATLGAMSGKAISGSAGAAALTSIEDSIDDEIPNFDAKAAAKAELEAEDASVQYDEPLNDDANVVDVKADNLDESFGNDVSDDELDALLKDL